MKDKTRCGWVAGGDAAYIRYHDEEWGVPVTNDRVHFEFLLLEGAQAGLSWRTVLNKRDNYRRAFNGFNPQKVARYDDTDIARLLENEGLIRNRLKMHAAVGNARAFLRVQQEFGTFNAYVWQFVGGKPKQNAPATMADTPATSAESDALSKDLKKRGFKFVGSTIIYAYMQAVGLVNDHEKGCFRRVECKRLAAGGNLLRGQSD